MLYFLALSVVLYATLLLVSPVTTTLTTRDNVPDFKCEEEFISHEEISKTLFYPSRETLDSTFPTRYKGSLFTGDKLWTLPVVTHKISEAADLLYDRFFIVYQDPLHLIGVYAVTWFDEHIKCSRISNLSRTPPHITPNLSPSHANHVIHGYQCGQRFFPQDLVYENLKLALNKIKNGARDYAYLSEIYSEAKASYRMWPLDEASQSGPIKNSLELDTYYLIIDEHGSLQEVGYLSYPENYRRCELIGNTNRNTLDPISSTTKLENVKRGFLCDIFFEDNYLLKSRKAASGSSNFGRSYPKPFKGTGPRLGSLIWPLSPKREVYVKGSVSYYFLVLSKTFKIHEVVFQDHDFKIHQCERQQIYINEESVTHGLHCHIRDISYEELKKTAQNACQRLYESSPFPYTYRGPKFDVSGPYLAYPENTKSCSTNSIWVVINHDCKIAGAIINLYNSYTKCLRHDSTALVNDSKNQIQLYKRFPGSLSKKRKLGN